MFSALRLAIYTLAFLLGAIGLSGIATVVGLFAFVFPGLILLAAPNVALYLPFADAIQTAIRKRRRLYLFPLLAALCGLAFGVPWWANVRTDARVSSLTRDDFGAMVGAPINTLFLSERGRLLGSRPGECGRLCSRLLVRGKVRTVMVPMDPNIFFDPSTPSDRNRAAVYALAPSPICDPLDDDQLEADLDVLFEIGTGACITRTTALDPVFDTALLVDVQRQSRKPSFNPFAVEIHQIERRRLWRCERADCHLTLLRTSVELRRLSLPLGIGITAWGSSPIREIARRTVKINETTDHQTLGLDSAFVPERKRPTRPTMARAQMRETASRILAASARDGRRLTPAELELLNQLLVSMYPPARIDDSDVAIVARILRHPTIDEGIYFPNLLRLRPELREALSKDLIESYNVISRREDNTQSKHATALGKEVFALSPERFCQDLRLRPVDVWHPDTVETCRRWGVELPTRQDRRGR